LTLHLFQGFGIELEYMVVDRTTLEIRPMVDELFRTVAGSYEQEVERREIAWSNELALHVVELKTNGPARDLQGLTEPFHRNVTELNELLKPWNAQLMPTAMHPTMDPETEMRLWPHGDQEIYKAYDRIFGCRGHGWSNLQSTHINLPFANDEEFSKLHAALRYLMPLLPGLWATSPVVEGVLTDLEDNRLEFYRHNQRRVPLLTGSVIPEPVYSKADYEALLKTLYQAVAPHDPDGLLQHEWVNSRGAIARFDRMALELRTLDIQECPAADITLACGFVALLKRVMELEDEELQKVADIDTESLSDLWVKSLRARQEVDLRPLGYCERLGLNDRDSWTLDEFWRALGPTLQPDLPSGVQPLWSRLIERGSLASEIRRRLSGDCTPARIGELYRELCLCLEENRILESCL
jgi:carboxylate-amine ligase